MTPPTIEKKKGPTDCVNSQPSLFNHSVIEAHRDRKFIVPKFTRRRKQARRRKRTMENTNFRQNRGQEIVQSIGKYEKFQKKAGYHLVPSQTSNAVYKVDATNFTCTCPDFTFRRIDCKHIVAVKIQQGRIEKENVVPFVGRNKYSQDWAAYNKSQTSEKAEFLRLMSDLTRGIEDEPQMNGRPSLPLGDMIFACVFKVFSQMSSRRFQTDLNDAYAKGFINECPSYNSLTRYMGSESLTPYLERLVEETSKPLASLETAFAVDSTGLSISNSVSWNRAKYKDQAMLKNKNWIKVHVCVGTHTNIITGVQITDKRSADGPLFIPVMDATRKNFTVKEVSADGAYSSQKHAMYAELHGFDSYIPFDEGSTASGHHGVSEVWRRLFHFFNFNRAEFVQKYMKRSNVETTFHMLKSKFGSTLKSRTPEAQKNEALCKVICHNIACLIHAINEFGIDV